jgi:D-alanyl-D-alanine carboxypeptidase/D-alanyl-D-alanine-endopeptidase (penicillin-binding protein 4)
MAEQLVRTLGSRAGELGSWPEGTRVVADYLVREVGVEPADVRVEDGSGLSVKNLVTPRALVALLDHARDEPWFRDFRSALPTPGQRGTTLETRLPGLEKRIFAKTGTLTNVATFAGYLLQDDGSAVAFAILANGSNLPSSAMNARIDAIAREIARGRIPE